MATIGSAKATLVNKIDSLTSSATAKDTIFLAKALKENSSLNNFVWQGPWTNSTAYYVDDVVTNSGNTYMCILAYTSAASPGAFAVGSNWSIMAEKGSTVGVGTAGQVLKTNSGATGIEWGVVEGTPSQTGNSGKVLTTNGTSMSWFNNREATQLFGTTGSWSSVSGWTSYVNQNITMSTGFSNFRDICIVFGNYAEMFTVPVAMLTNANVPSNSASYNEHMIPTYSTNHVYWRPINDTTIYITSGGGSGVYQVWGIK